ncbi:MAG: ABC transporter permease [Roseburia sp.]|nr:ABC transporter permease [Roseburia sp.]MCM1097491.1 ABC transporter permease [Ruminococcus flavefaciens]
MLDLLQCEYRKLKRSAFLLIGLAGTLIVPIFVIVKSVLTYFSNPEAAISLFSLYDGALMFLMLLFGPLFLTILGSWIISREYTDGTLKNIFVIPVSKAAFLCGKLLFFALLSLSFMLVSCLEILALAFLVRLFLPVAELTVPSVLYFLLKMLYGGLLLFAAQTPLIYLAIRTKGFVAPMVAVAAILLINVVLSNSVAAGYYPWSAAYLLVTGRFAGQSCPKEVSLLILLVLCLVGIAAGVLRFQGDETV